MQELDRMLAESNRLNDSRRYLEHALKDTENPLHVTKECLYFRENRQGGYLGPTSLKSIALVVHFGVRSCW